MSTTTPKRSDPMNRLYRTRWFMPAFSLFLGALMFVAFWIGDNPGQGAAAAAVMAVRAAGFFLGARRSVTLAGLGGPAPDERGERQPVRPARRRRRPRLRPRGRAPALALLSAALRSPAERHGPGGPSGLQNRQAVVARRLEGSIPSPLRLAL